MHIQRKNCVKIHHYALSVLLFVGCVQAENDVQEQQPPPISNEDVVVARFPDIYGAKAMVKSLRALGQQAEIRHQTKSITLKTISITGYKSPDEAEKTVAVLKKNGIDAYTNKISTHDYVVHAGAIHDEIFFWGRYERLKSLGYNQLSTGVKPYDTDQYAIIQARSVPEYDPDDYRPNRRIKHPTHGEILGRLNQDYENYSVSSSNRLSALLHGQWQLNPRWELALGMRIDAKDDAASSLSQRTDYNPLANYIAFHTGKQRLSAGWQMLEWSPSGRDSWSDALNPRDLSYFVNEPEIQHRRRSVATLRWETEFGGYHIDTVWLPYLRPATLPDTASIWYPVNQTTGKIRGTAGTATYAQLIKQGVFNDTETRQSGSAGMQITEQKGARYQTITIQYTRLSEPYFKLNDTVRERLANGLSVEDSLLNTTDTFTVIHPLSWILSVEEGTPAWQFEVSALDGLPVTTTDYRSLQAVAMELYAQATYEPRKANIQHRFALHGRMIGTDRPLLNRKQLARYEGNFLWHSESRKWEFSFAYTLGLDKVEAHLSPRVAYRGNPFLDIALVSHAYAGSAETEYGYHHGQAVTTLEWNARF